MNKSLLIRAMFVGFVALVVLGVIAIPQTINADQPNLSGDINKITLVHDGHLTICKLDKSSYHVVKTIKKAVVTGYSSTKDQTDSTPFITADGTDLRDLKDGEEVIATNILPMGTMVRLTIGDKVIIAKVRDRMNAKYNGQARFDLYFKGDGNAGKKEAIEWGAKVLPLEVIES